MRTSAIFLSLFVLSQTIFAQSGWFWQNPLPQGNELNDIYTFDGHSAVFVGDAGTVLKTTNGGLDWAVQHPIEGTTERLKSVFFIDSNTGWAVGSAGIILKSSDFN